MVQNSREKQRWKIVKENRDGKVVMENRDGKAGGSAWEQKLS